MDAPESANPAAPQADGDVASATYEELRRIAKFYLGKERRGHTLQPTELVHEAYLKLSRRTGISSSSHFAAVAAQAMRQILVDYARRRATAKRGGNWLRVTLSEAVSENGEQDVDLLVLEDALNELAELRERCSRVVELRFFGGLTCEEAANVLEISPKTAEADWYFARAWLRRRLGESQE